ncbi:MULTISPECIES: leucine-rich repeat domain-containing protein [unclassified Chryseobacterium]|uniref:leucine-rich repeat domain-containing protein n=1 Tax=unclassified Chryseobacterium TaxID=2593645 RepID=UPI003015BCE4
MNDLETIISKLENALHIKLAKEDKDSENFCYISGRLTYLSLSNLHFEDFSALEPVFETLYTLILTECSIANANDMHRMKKLETLVLKKCSISMEETFDPDISKANTTKGNFESIYLEDMDVTHPGFFLPISKYLHDITFTECTVSNIYELNLFPSLYYLNINNSQFITSENDIQHKQNSIKKLNWLKFENMKLKNFDSYLPVLKEITVLKLYDCELDSLKNISQFPHLKRLHLDPELKINDPNSEYDNSQHFKLKECIIQSFVSFYDWTPDVVQPDFDAKLLLSAAPYLRNLTVEGYKLINTDYLKHLPKLNQLNFEKCTVDLEDYLSVAPQIKRIYFNTSEIKNQYAFKYFTKLEKITVSVDRPEDRNLIDLEKLLPLKESLKKIILWNTEIIQNIDQITNFTTLEELDIRAESVEFAQKILSMESLKNLDLNIYIKEQEPEITEPIILDLQHLKNVEKLHLGTVGDFYFKGIGHLKSLKKLILDDDCDLESLAQLPSLKKLFIEVNAIDKLPRLEHVKVLKLYSRGEYCEINLHDKFPNLKKLDLRASEEQKINISNLEKLKILTLFGSDFDGIVSLENLPKLEELDLGYCGISTVTKLDNLTHLKTLNLEENEIENIAGLENLKNLERLNLYDNKIYDISILNKLPKLREANLARNKIKKEDAEKQLDKPEVGIWYYRPSTPFRIIID